MKLIVGSLRYSLKTRKMHQALTLRHKNSNDYAESLKNYKRNFTNVSAVVIYNSLQTSQNFLSLRTH